MADQMKIQSMWMKHLFQNIEDYKNVRLYLLTVMGVIIIIIMCDVFVHVSSCEYEAFNNAYRFDMFEKINKFVTCI